MTDKPPTAMQIAAQALARAEESHALSAENNIILKRIDAAWMQPHPAYGDRSLLDCVSTLVVEANAGKIVGKRIVFWGSVVLALGALAAFFGISNGAKP